LAFGDPVQTCSDVTLAGGSILFILSQYAPYGNQAESRSIKVNQATFSPPTLLLNASGAAGALIQLNPKIKVN